MLVPRPFRFNRRSFIKALPIIGATGVLVGWGISRTTIPWQIGEFAALAALGGNSQQVNDAVYAGIEQKVVFGADPQQYVFVFPPLEMAPRRNSIVFFLHGGGWNMGNPDLYRFVGRFFAQRGFPTILGGYRLTPSYRFPTQLEDTAASLRTGIDELRKYMVSAQRIVVGGHSAGAQLASLLAYNQQVAPTERPMFAGLFSLSGPLDFALCQNGQIRRLLDDYVGQLPREEIANPIAYADPTVSMSVLCLHGAHDPIVDPANSIAFATKLNQGAIQRAQIHILENTYHSDMLNLFFAQSDTTKLLIDWLVCVDQSPPVT